MYATSLCHVCMQVPADAALPVLHTRVYARRHRSKFICSRTKIAARDARNAYLRSLCICYYNKTCALDDGTYVSYLLLSPAPLLLMLSGARLSAHEHCHSPEGHVSWTREHFQDTAPAV